MTQPEENVRIIWRPVVWGLLALMLAVVGGCLGLGDAEKKYQVAVVPMGESHAFWKSVHEGVREAGDQFNVEIVFSGPNPQNDRLAQQQLVQQRIAEGVDAIAWAPIDSSQLLPDLQQAAAHDPPIPVSLFGTALDSSDVQAGRDFVSLIGTDDSAAGRTAAEHLNKLLGGEGVVVMLRYIDGPSDTQRREEAFLEALRQQEEIAIVVKDRYVNQIGPTGADAERLAEILLDRIEQADGVFTSNQPTTEGTLAALKKAGLAGRVRFVGFGASPPLVAALKDGHIDALLVEDPRKMGYESVRVLVDHLDGKTVPKRIEVGVTLVTSRNVDDPEVARLLPR